MSVGCQLTVGLLLGRSSGVHRGVGGLGGSPSSLAILFPDDSIGRVAETLEANEGSSPSTRLEAGGIEGIMCNEKLILESKCKKS